MKEKSNLEPSTSSPYLSVVAASRNDDHGGDPLLRTQIFLTSFARQCEKYGLKAEMILVDWNPVRDRPGLAAVLKVPPDAPNLSTRVITVPNALHRRLKYSEGLPLFQMIAKNVGIRRARGRFILATNIDIIFSDELIGFIAKQKLRSDRQYRVDRYDIKSGLNPDSTLDEVLAFAWSNPIRSNRRYEPARLVQHLYGQDVFKRVCSPDPAYCGYIDGVEVIQEDGVWQIHPERSAKMTHLHTNACGDFTLLSREGWEAIRGYPEFAAYSFNIDSMGLIAAHYSGYQEVSLLPPCVCFHIEHGAGSGWTPEGETKLFDRLRNAGVLSPEWPVLTPLVEAMREEQKCLEFNHSGWGMGDLELPERPIGDTSETPQEAVEQVIAAAGNREMSAIQPAYDLDRLTLAYERRVAEEQRHLQGYSLNAETMEDLRSSSGPLGVAVTTQVDRVVLYIPDTTGGYSETRSLVQHANLANSTVVVFRVEQFAHRFPLRLDPCQRPGLVSITSLTIFDTRSHRLVWGSDSRDLAEVGISGTAVMMPGGSGTNGHWKRFFQLPRRDFGEKLRLISTGLDPQVILPLLPNDIKFPIIVAFELSVVPCE